MGKGGYLGGGTIIGPQTPEWFGHGHDAVEEHETATEPSANPQKPTLAQLRAQVVKSRRPGPLTRNQRRKQAALRRQIREAKNAGEAKPMKRDLTTREAAEITTLRQVLKLSQQAHDKAKMQLKADREALNTRLAKLGLPLED